MGATRVRVDAMTGKALCDRALAIQSAGGGVSGRPQLLLVATILASSLDFIDGSVINVGLPAIGRSLRASATELQWAVNAYLLPLSALLLLGGALGDLYGRRRLLLVGISLFATGSAGCAFAASLDWLVAARILQGLAAALMLPNSLAILGDGFEGKERDRAVGIWAACASVASAIGPLLGGWLVDTAGWRAIFLINLPLAAAATAFVVHGVSKDDLCGTKPALDIKGAAFATGSIIGLAWGLTEGVGPRGWSVATVTAILAGLVLTAAFIAIERAKGDRAMTPLALFGSKPLVALNLLTLLLYGTLAAYTLLLPYLLITIRGYSATAAGAALLPFPLIMGALSPVAGRVAGRFGSRWLLIAGPALVALGFLLAIRATSAGPYVTHVLPSIIVVAVGMTCAAAPLTASVLQSVNRAHIGAASGLNSAVAQLGGVIAIALVGAVLSKKGAVFVGTFDAVSVFGASTALAAATIIAVLFTHPPTHGAASHNPGQRL
jgi:EmrB/QacA subfamily drug resistance transporter